LGGAANVAVNLTAFGAKVHLMGCVGADARGDLAIEMAKKCLFDVSGIFRSGKRTTSKTRIVSKGQQMLRIDNEDISDIPPSEEESFFKIISNKLRYGGISGIVLQDYNKGIFTASLIDRIITLAHEQGIPFFVDPKHKNFWMYKGATLFKPNLSEIMQANSPKEYLSNEELLLSSARKLKCKILMCTLAEKGIAFVENEKVEYTPTQKIDVIDVSGAGDTSLAIMVLAYLLGYDTKSISILANLCGKVVCMKSGVSTMTLEELKTAFYALEENLT
jgi:rfaE bifunctional protein kinase chain/domain